MKKLTLLLLTLATILIVSCEKHEKQKVLRNGTAVEVDAALPAPEIEQTKRTPPADGKYPIMTFAETEFDFGDIKQGEKVTHEFSFTNTGEADLVITNAYGSCGCTVPKYPKEAIKPGGSGRIHVTFDSAGKKGRQQKSVTLMTNTAKEKEQLQIKVNINPGT